MSRYKIYSAQGVLKAQSTSLEYDGKWMGESHVTLNVSSPTPIKFALGDYIDYRGVRYTLNYEPSVVKQARTSSVGNAYVYDSLTFNGPSDELTRCLFLDYVQDDGSATGSNSMHYSNGPTFSFFCEDVRTLVERIAVNLKRTYGDRWEIRLSEEEFESAHNKFVDADKMTIWDALGLVSSVFKTSFVIRQEERADGERVNVIVVGEVLIVDHNVLRYGKGKGLTKLERMGDSSQQIINRLWAYGSTKNLPARYYNDVYDPWYKVNVVHDTTDRGDDGLYTLRYYTANAEEIFLGLAHNTDYKVVVGYTFENEYKSGIASFDAILSVKSGEDYTHPTQNITIEGLGKGDADLLEKRTFVYIMDGLTMSETKYNKSQWISVVALAPNNMSVNRLMMPSFLNYFAIDAQGEEVLLPKGGTERILDKDGNVTSYNYNKASYTPVYVLDADGKHVLDDDGHWLTKLNYDTSIDDAASIAKYGVREGVVNFDVEDESSDTPEIYPTIQGMTADEVRASGRTIKLPPDDNGALDEVMIGTDKGDYEITVDGYNKDEENPEPSDFYIELKDIGFDIKDYLGEESAVLRMETGMCAGREFELVDSDANPEIVEHEGYTGYKVWLKRVADETLFRHFPNSDFPVSAGDKFVLLNIDMPRVYVDAASERLRAAAEEYLKKNSVAKLNYIPTLDKVAMARDLDARGEDSLHYKLSEGSVLQFSDSDLEVDIPTDRRLFIDTLTIREREGSIAEYDIKLSEEKEFSTIEKIQNDISVIKGGAFTGVSASQAKHIATSVGDRNYVSKQHDDTVQGRITFEQEVVAEGGVKSSDFNEEATGYGVWKDGEDWHMEADFLHLRKKILAKEVEIKSASHIGGELLLTAASLTALHVEDLDEAYRVYFRSTDNEGNEIANEWAVGDQAYHHTFNLTKRSDEAIGNRYYWRLVTGVSEGVVTLNIPIVGPSVCHYIDLSKTDSDENSDAPNAGDKVVQLGNRNGTGGRSSAIFVSGAGGAAPSIRQFDGITSYSLGEADTQIKPGDNRFTGRVTIAPGSSGLHNFSDLPEAVAQALEIGGENLLLNSGFDGEYDSLDLTMDDLMSDTELYSNRMRHWEGDGESVEELKSVSGFACLLPSRGSKIGQLVQGLSSTSAYMSSFDLYGKVALFVNGAFVASLGNSEAYSHYYHETAAEQNAVELRFVGMEAGVRVFNVKLERGKVATDWCPSPKDKDKVADEFRGLWYLQHALRSGKTEVLNGLILSSLIQLGYFRDEQMERVTAGMNGVYTTDEDVAFWGGGSLEQAIKAVNAYRTNPQYEPSEEELSAMAKTVFTHGGRGILNDVILRGYVYALGGRFRGSVEAESGYFKGELQASRVLMNKTEREYDAEGNEVSAPVEVSGAFITGRGRYVLPELEQGKSINVKWFNPRYLQVSHQTTTTFEAKTDNVGVAVLGESEVTYAKKITISYTQSKGLYDLIGDHPKDSDFTYWTIIPIGNELSSSDLGESPTVNPVFPNNPLYPELDDDNLLP